ncbi:MAG: malate synthase A [Myxococcales bacterium]|nr:malate synthase A [Myxococcales bacterium]
MTPTNASTGVVVSGVVVTDAPASLAAFEHLLTEGARSFLADLVRRFRPAIDEALLARAERKRAFDGGALPDFLPETRSVREDASWRVAPIPRDLEDRRVEITGPVDRKMIVNALGSGANVFMADFEDATAPTWDNLLAGQQNLFDAVRRQIDFTAPETGKRYALPEKTATLFVRPRGLHLPERHFVVDGRPAPGSLFDFGLFFFHNAKELLVRGTGSYFYVPKLESHREARIWNQVFAFAEAAVGVPAASVRATVLIETLPAAFEMDEILFELRERSAGLNCGRWDYIFSFIKKLGTHADRILPDRALVTMGEAFLLAYSELLIKTCHRRGIHAMGGMAAQIPIKGDAARNEQSLEKVRADKLREVQAGHDGTWVAHPGLIAIARAVFDEHMPGAHQIARARDDVSPSQSALLAVPGGKRTEAGLRHNVRVGIQYLEAWLGGQGCVPLYDLMEDAATAEISRAQIWQWLHHGVTLDGGPVVTAAFVASVVDEELARIRGEVGAERFERGHFPRAKELFLKVATTEPFEDFLTLPAYGDLS